jgi:hypothetical protein
MQKSLWLTVCGIAMAGMAVGQIKKQFTVESAPACENIKLHLRANSGNCYIKPSQNTEILNVFSNQDESSYSHNYRKETRGKTCEVSLNLEEVHSEGFSQTISTKMFGNTDKPVSDKIWKMYLTDSKPYQLELEYAVGNAHVDLSGLSIKNLKINTGSADVNVSYSSLENQIDMDTFSVKVDLGSLSVKNLNLSRTKYMVADVGFGNMMLDFSNNPSVSNKIKGSVGAGNLVIILPSDQTPVMVTVKDSWLCSVHVPESLKKVSENKFANAAYSNSKEKNPKNALVFDLDVSMGSITFKDAKN